MCYLSALIHSGGRGFGGDRGGGSFRDRESSSRDGGGFGGSFGGNRDRDSGSAGSRGGDRFGAYGAGGSGGSRSGNTSRFSDERFERAPRSSGSAGAGFGGGSRDGGALADPFNGYGNGAGNYAERRPSREAWGTPAAGMSMGANSNNKYAGKAKYESFDFEADDFDDVDIARRANSFRKGN